MYVSQNILTSNLQQLNFKLKKHLCQVKLSISTNIHIFFAKIFVIFYLSALEISSDENPLLNKNPYNLCFSFISLVSG